MLIGFLTHSFIVVPIFMELSLDKPKKTEEGRLRIRKKSFVIKFFYGENAGEKIKDKRFPKNICQLYKGIWGGIFFFLLAPSLYYCFLVLLYGVAGLCAFIAGYLPNLGGLKARGDAFYPYEERSGDKKWIAPWKFVLPIGLVVLIYFFHREIFTNLIKISRHFSSTTGIIVYGSIAGLVFLIIVINKIRKTESFVAMKETVVSFVKKMCKEIEST